EYLDKYLEIEQVRFGDRLEVRRSIEPGALDLLVPNLVLQPLVENAVRHGIAPRASGGCINVVANESEGKLVIEVCANVAGAGEMREGFGIANTRAGRAQLYGSPGQLELGNAPGGGFRARLGIPAHTEPLHAGADR